MEQGNSSTEKFVDKCCLAVDVDPSGQYPLGTIFLGEKSGIYEVSISERKCVPLLPGVVTFNAVFALDGKSFLYAVASRGEVTINPPGVARWQPHRVAPSRVEGPFCFSPRLSGWQRLRLLQRPFHYRLCASRRSRRPLSSEPEVKVEYGFMCSH
jgi:hypothetical protein